MKHRVPVPAPHLARDYLYSMALPIILLDFDDVLASTRALRTGALRASLAVDGLSLTDDLYETSCAGLSFTGAARAACRALRASADETAIELAAVRADREYARRAARGVALAVGAADFVRGAAGAARLGVVTRSARRDVSLLLAFAGLEDAFECIVTEEDYSGPEPSPEPFAHARIRLARRAPVALGEGVALVASLGAASAARAARFRPIVVGPVPSPVAFAGDGWIASLEGMRVADVMRISDGAQAS
jgi:beta-phosphoglucomutase-like phosphatase (HAD superfamily)